MLGDGFRDVAEPELLPVVAFQTAGDVVRLNVGLTPFAYAAATVPAAVLAGRELLRQVHQTGLCTLS